MVDIINVNRPDGARLSVQIAGDSNAPVLLLLQGQASSHTWWTGIRERYEDRYRTATMDYRGTGATRDSGGVLNTSLIAEDAIAVLDHLGVDRAHVYGTSMGGRIAQHLAGSNPDRVQTLALACTSPGGPYAVERNNDVRKALSSPDPAARQRALVDLFYTPAWGDDLTKSRLFGDPTTTATDKNRHLKMSARHDAWDLLPHISSPTLILHGKHDQMTPDSNAAILAERIPGADMYIHPSGRHGFFDEFAPDLDSVLDQLWTTTRR